MMSSFRLVWIAALFLTLLKEVQSFKGSTGRVRVLCKTGSERWGHVLPRSRKSILRFTSSQRNHFLPSTSASMISSAIHGGGDDSHPYGLQRAFNRRKVLQTVLTTIPVTSAVLVSCPRISGADDTSAADVSQILLRLKSIPTFCIVDPKGVPFMIFDGQASATGYFFLSFDIAVQALTDAKRKDTNAGAAAIWEQARIVVVPLAVALQISLRKSQRVAVNNGIRFNTYGDIVPSQEGIDDAKAIDSSTTVSSLSNKWGQKGRVPLFYISDLRLDNGRQPRYFNQRDLLKEWNRQHPEQPSVPPKIQIVEMVDLYRSALMGKNSDLAAIQNVAIMPVAETSQVASQLLQQQPKDNPLPKYDFNMVYLVGSAQG